MGRMERFLKTSLIYLVGQMSAKFLAVLLLPIFTSRLSPSEFGYFDVAAAVINLAVAVVFGEVASALLRFGLEAAGLKHDRSTIASTALISFAASAVVFVALGFFFGRSAQVSMWPAIVAFGLASAFNIFMQCLARIYEANIAFMVSGVVNSLVTSLLNIACILGLGLGVLSLFVSGVAGCLVQSGLLLVALRGKRWFRFSQFSLVVLRSMLRFSLPLVFNSIALWCSTGLLRLLVAQKVGVQGNGLIAVGDRFLIIMTVFSTITSMAWQEAAFRGAKSTDRGRLYSRALDLNIRAMGIGVCVLIPVTAIVFPYLVDSSYDGVRPLLPAYFVVSVVTSIGSLLETVFTAERKTLKLFWSTLTNAVLSVIVFLVLEPVLGVAAFVVGSLAGLIAMVSLRFAMASHDNPDLLLHWRPLLVALVAYGVSCLGYFYASIGLNAVIFVLMFGLLIFQLRDFLGGLAAGVRRGRRD